MTMSTRPIITWGVIVSALAGFNGCQCPTTPSKGITIQNIITIGPGMEQVPLPLAKTPDENPTLPEGVTNVVDPSGSSGTLTVPVTQFSPGDDGLGCFPAAQGWNKYWVTFYFLGPNVSPLPNPNNYPNPDNLNSVTIDTLAVENGSTLNTGIVIVDNLNPNNKVCNNDASPSYTPNPKLSKATFSPTGTGKKYRAGIYYKGTAPPGLTDIVVHWSYP